MAQLDRINTEGLTAEDMVFVSYQGAIGDDNAVSICHYSILNFANCDVKQFETEAEAELISAVEAGWTPRGVFTQEVLLRK